MMSTVLHKVRVGNQTDKALFLIMNNLDPRLAHPRQYVEWDAFPTTANVEIIARDQAAQWIHLGSFSYSNLAHDYADIHVFTSVQKHEGSDFLTLYYYLEGDTIHPFAFVKKTVWDSLSSDWRQDE